MSPESDKNIAQEPVVQIENVDVYYGTHKAVAGVNIDIPKNNAVAFIGPSGCGKSTILRCINRMNDLVASARVQGRITFKGKDIYAKGVDPVGLRSRIGMVFQKANPFPKSIYENIAWGARLNGYQGNMDDLVEDSLRKAAVWDEVKDKLKQSGP